MHAHAIALKQIFSGLRAAGRPLHLTLLCASLAVLVSGCGQGRSESAHAAARNALRLARLRYDAGYSAYLEVLDAQRTASDAELAFLRNRQSRLVASVDLMKALGGGWSGGAMPLASAAPRDGGGK